MADEVLPPQVSFAAGFPSLRVMSEFREAIEHTWFQMLSVDAGPLGAGATITSAMISQATGYQINSSMTWFTTVTPAVTGNGNTPTAACVLPQTNRPYPFTGMQIAAIANYGTNPINCFAHPNDAGNSINGLAANTPVVLGPNTITPFQAITAGVWNAVDIGGGFNASIETVVSQGVIVGSTTNTQAGATPITQAMVAVSSSQANCAVALPKAKAGTTITVNPTGSAGNTPLNVYPQNGSNDTINGGAANSPIALTLAATSPTIFFCFVDGAWTTK